MNSLNTECRMGSAASGNKPDDRVDAYSVTVIPEENGATRNLLFAAALVLLVMTLLTGTVVNLFGKDLDVGSINEDVFNAVIVDDIPEPVEKAPEVKKDTGKGGGGGGDHDPIPASQGDRAPMRTDPQFAPSVSMNRLTNPTIPIQMAIKGPINERLDTSRYGVKLGGDTPSDGPGSNGGQGPGRDGGQGPGAGPGYGPGKNGALGDGPTGGLRKTSFPDGEDRPPDRGLTTALKILNKPRPSFTDAARQNGVQGIVVLRVTFTADGSVGKIDVVRGLPDGLTERAIAAARKITFEPVMVNGRPQTVTKQIEYTFYIY
jgi:TonB family protein